MNAATALKKIRELARQGRVRFERTGHAAGRMAQKDRNFQVNDVLRILTHGSRAEPSVNDRWVVHGKDLDGKLGRVVCVIEDDVIVITVIR